MLSDYITACILLALSGAIWWFARAFCVARAARWLASLLAILLVGVVAGFSISSFAGKLLPGYSVPLKVWNDCAGSFPMSGLCAFADISFGAAFYFAIILIFGGWLLMLFAVGFELLKRGELKRRKGNSLG